MSNSNKMVLFVLAFVLVGLLYYFVPYKMLDAKQSTLSLEVNNLQNNYNQLSQDLLQKDQYIEDTEAYMTRLDELAERLPQNLPQENMIALVHDIEDMLEMNIAQFSMSDETVVSSYQDPNNIENTDIGITATMNTNLTLTYDQLIDFLNYINNNPYRMVLRDLSLVSNIETGMISTTVNLSTYGMKIPGREDNVVISDAYDYGKGSIFEPYGDYADDFIVSPSMVVTDEDAPDFIIMLEPLISDRTTSLIGKSGDVNAVTYITDESEGVVEGTIEFYQANDAYFYKYALPTRSYPANYNVGIQFDPGEELEIQIFSKDRVDENDISGLHLQIINSTDKSVNLVYYSEDFDNPRFTYESNGEVIVH